MTIVDDGARCPALSLIRNAMDNLSRHSESLHHLSTHNLGSSWDGFESDDCSFYDDDIEESHRTSRSDYSCDYYGSTGSDDDTDIFTAVTTTSTMSGTSTVSAPPAISDARWGESPSYISRRKVLANKADMGLTQPSRRISQESEHRRQQATYYGGATKKKNDRRSSPSKKATTRLATTNFFKEFDSDYFGSSTNKSKSGTSPTLIENKNHDRFSSCEIKSPTTSTRATVSVNAILSQAIELANSPPTMPKKTSSYRKSSTSSSSSSSSKKTKKDRKKSRSSSSSPKKSTSTLAQNLQRHHRQRSPIVEEGDNAAMVLDEDTCLVAVDSLVEQAIAASSTPPLSSSSNRKSTPHSSRKKKNVSDMIMSPKSVLVDDDHHFTSLMDDEFLIHSPAARPQRRVVMNVAA